MKKVSKKINKLGFTIVELLIVIVVISILASITVVAFNGIQDRALNTSRISYARNALNVLHVYKNTHGQYPTIPDSEYTTAGTRAACLGEGWPLLQGDPVCWNIYTDEGAPGPSTFPQVDAVNDALDEVAKLGDYPQTIVWSGMDGSNRPVDLNAMALVERPAVANTIFPLGYSLAYILEGDPNTTSCGISGAEEQSFGAGVNIVRCIVPLP